jgi:hypothetical protein
MFDVQSVCCAGQAEFHLSGAAGLKRSQLDHQETVPFWCRFIQTKEKRTWMPTN